MTGREQVMAMVLQRLMPDAAVRERFTDSVLDCLTGIYTTDKGATHFAGQSVSHLVRLLREKGWRRLPLPNEMLDVLEGLGFEVVKAQMVKGSGRLAGYGQIVRV